MFLICLANNQNAIFDYVERVLYDSLQGQAAEAAKLTGVG